jgi:hypothetical protein
MGLLATSAGRVTAHQAFVYVGRGIKAFPVAIYHLAVRHNAASLREVLYLVGVILLGYAFAGLIMLLRR